MEAVFNPGFDPSALIVRMYYTTMSQTVNNVRMARGEDATQSLFGWQQYYCNKRDAYQSYHQILVRMPLTTRDMTINDEGRVILQDQDSWMIWEPYVSDFDVLVISAHHTASKREERYEISDKRDSIIQGHLMSQRFHLHLLEFSDTRYNVPITTTPV